MFYQFRQFQKANCSNNVNQFRSSLKKKFPNKNNLDFFFKNVFIDCKIKKKKKKIKKKKNGAIYYPKCHENFQHLGC